MTINFATFACCALLSSSAAAADPAGAPEHGSWQKHEYSFVFVGFTSTYSCDGLADQLRVLLLASGARADAKARPGACIAMGRPDKFSRADLTFYTLSPAAADTGVEGADGVWRAVKIADRSPREIELGDCELVDQFRRDVLPMFVARDIVARTTCVPNEVSGSLIDLRFQTFAAVVQKTAPPDRSGGAH